MALTAKEIAERNLRLVARKLQSPTISFTDLGAEFNISGKQARRAYHQYESELMEQFVLDTSDYLKTVAVKIAAYEELRGQLASTAAAASNVNLPARVGALKAIADIHAREIVLLQATGLMPNDLGLVRVQLDVRTVTNAFIAIFHKYLPKKVAAEAEAELLEALRPGLSRRQALTIAEGEPEPTT